MTDKILSTEINRRTLLQGAAALAVPVALARPSLRGAVTTSSRLPLMSAAQSEKLAAAIGVVIHLSYSNTAYGQTDRVVDAVADLGVRHVRNRVATTAAGRRGFTALAQKGIKVHGVCGAFGDPQSMFDVMNEVVTTYPDPEAVFSAFEGINEPNNNGVPWIEETRAKTRSLYVQRNAHGLNNIPILAPALARVNSGGAEGRDLATQSANLGDLTQYIDLGNVHVYPRGMVPSTDLDDFMGYQRNVCGDRQMMCTEGGYFTGLNYVGGSNPTPQEAVAKYVPRQIMEHWSRGNKRFFTYELLDDHDPSNADRESNFGLLGVSSDSASGTWTPKAQYRAIRNFVSILGDPGAGHQPKGLNVSITGVPDIRTSLVSKRNGGRFLLMWRDVSCYDTDKRAFTDSGSQTATVTLPAKRRVSVFNPTRSATPVQRFGVVNQFKVKLADELLICRIL